MKRKELDKILQEHRQWLESDEESGKRADLRNADLRGAGLEGADLKDTGILVYQAERDRAIYTPCGMLSIGCERHSIEHWLEHYQEIGEKYKYSQEEIHRYKIFMDICYEETKNGAV